VKMRFAIMLSLALAAQCAFAGGAESIRQLLNSRAAGSVRTYEAAAAEVAAEAEKGHPLQQFIIATISRDHMAPPAARISEEKREEYFSASRDKIRALAEKRGNSLAWYLLSLESNDRKLLRRAVEGENVQALNAWGTLQLRETLLRPGIDTNGVFKIMEKARECFEKAAAQKDSNGLYNLGMCFLNGYGCAVDQEKALEYFKAAAKLDHPEAINNIGGFYRDGIVVEKDDFLATRQFARSAEMGNAYGELNYGLALQRGEGVAKDEKRAVELFKSAAQQGNAEAMNAYGMCLFNGTGAEKDAVAAVAWYRRSAARGFPPAMENLAVCYEAGAGGLEKSFGEGTVWKMRARAAKGDRNAAVWLSQNGHSLR